MSTASYGDLYGGGGGGCLSPACQAGLKQEVLLVNTEFTDTSLYGT